VNKDFQIIGLAVTCSLDALQRQQILNEFCQFIFVQRNDSKGQKVRLYG